MPTSLRELTTIRVGGTPHEIIEPRTREDLIAAARRAWLAGDEFVILGGGSNLVFADSLERLTVLRVLTRGIEILDETPAATNSVTVRVQAGESWDELVALAVDRGGSGLVALGGFPGPGGGAWAMRQWVRLGLPMVWLTMLRGRASQSTISGRSMLFQPLSGRALARSPATTAS